MSCKPADPFAPLLSVQDLVTTIATDHGMIRAVNHVSFDLHTGKSLGIVGESGSGKSLMCKSILRLLPEGASVLHNSAITFNGIDLNTLPEKALNKIRGRDIAFIFQEPMSSLNPVMKIGAQISESLIYHWQLEKKAATERAVYLLNSVGVTNPGRRIHQYPHQLSGGMQQRVAIAIAIACEPKLLIADEPTTAVDVTVQAEILELLGRIQDERKMAIILVTHDFGVAAYCAHEIAVMYAGRIVEYAPANALLNNPRMPYTKALMDSIPRLENAPHTPLHFINGRPPDLMLPYEGCAFAPRCVYADRRCRKQKPPLISQDSDPHFFACFNPLHRNQ